MANQQPDHLDRHGTMEHYAEIKSRLVAKSIVPIIGDNDDYSSNISDNFDVEGKAAIRISNQKLFSGLGVLDEQIVEFNAGDEDFIANLHGIATD